MAAADYILKIISLLGGLSLFLFGMEIMGKTLERQAGGALQRTLSRVSGNVLGGFFLGAAVTAVIQSSSATTVMTVGFVNSGILTLRQSVGIIMGSNVGTTITSWLLSLSALEGDSLAVLLFRPTTLAPLLGSIGIVLLLFAKKRASKNIGAIFLGFTVLMTGMELMSGAMEFLREEAWFGALMLRFSHPVTGVLAGALLTAVIQSSSASVGILQSLCATGLVTYGTALPIILGQNIGTCVTALLSTVGGKKNARRTAVVHLYFNLIGVLLTLFVVYIANGVTPLTALYRPANQLGIAVLHTGFNLLTTLVLLPAHRLLEKLAVVTVPDQKSRKLPPQKKLRMHRTRK